MKVKIDEDLCTGCEDCVNEVPEVFEMNDDGLAQVKSEDVPSEQEAKVKQSAEDCPASAIEVEE